MAKLFQHGVGLVTQIKGIVGKGEMFPQVQAVPGSTGQVDLPSAGSKRVVRGIDYPSVFHLLRVFANGGEVLSGVLTERLSHGIQIVQHGVVALAEVTGLGEPVHHLQVDVAMIIVAPRCMRHAIPDALQTCRKASGTGGVNHKIATEVVEGVLKFRIIGIPAIGFQSLRRGQVLKRIGRRSE